MPLVFVKIDQPPFAHICVVWFCTTMNCGLGIDNLEKQTENKRETRRKKRIIKRMTDEHSSWFVTARRYQLHLTKHVLNASFEKISYNTWVTISCHHEKKLDSARCLYLIWQMSWRHDDGYLPKALSKSR